MIGEKKLFKRLEKVLASSSADQTEAVYIGNESGLTRYANSYIHQNVYENNRQVFFRAVLGKKVGVASTNSMIPEDLEKTLGDAIEIARQQPENPHFPGLPKPAKYKEVDTFDEETAKFTPKDRAKKVKTIIARAGEKGFTVAGALASGQGEIAVVNSRGLRAYQPVTSASVNMVIMSDTSSGYAGGTSRHISQLDFDTMAERAVTKCDLAQNPQPMEPGEYEVILEPTAVAEALEWLNYIGFGSKPFVNKQSFLCEKIDQRITSDMISIFDNGLDDRSVAMPFDMEGVPKKKVRFIDKGVAKGVVWDRLSAAKEGGKLKSTGHALTPSESGEGAFGMNIFMAAGKAKRNKMIEKVKRGILVTRFHYINGFIDPRNSVLTGMTRDGTFLIEDGEIKHGLKNLRFTDSMMRAFGTVEALSRERERIESWWSAVGCMTVPTIHLKSFKFSGKTEH